MGAMPGKIGLSGRSHEIQKKVGPIFDTQNTCKRAGNLKVRYGADPRAVYL